MKASIKILILILLLSATCKTKASNLQSLPFESWQQAIKRVLEDYRTNDLTKQVSDTIMNKLIDQIIEEREKNASDTLIMVIEGSEKKFTTYISQKVKITEICITEGVNGNNVIKTSNPLHHYQPPLLTFYRPIDLFLLYARNWCLPIPKFLSDLIIDQFQCERPHAIRIIKSNGQFLIERHELGDI